MPVFLDPPVDVTPATFGVYTKVDVSAHVSAAATGAILRVATPDGFVSAQSYALRRDAGGGNLYDDLPANSHNWEPVPLDSSGRFEARLESDDFTLELVGYFEEEGDFASPPVDVTPAWAGYSDVDISAHTDPDTAVAAMLLFRPIGDDVFARAKGSAVANLAAAPLARQAILTGVDAEEVLQAYSDSSSQRLYLVGWLKEGIVLDASPVDVTPGVSENWTTHELPAGATGAVFWAVLGDDDEWGARAKGSGLDWKAEANSFSGFAIVGADENGEVELYVQRANEDKIYRLGYFFQADDYDLTIDSAESATELSSFDLTMADNYSIAIDSAESATELSSFSLTHAFDTSPPVIALVAQPFDSTIEVAQEGPPVPAASGPATDFAFSSFGAETEIFAADVTYDSRASDTPAAMPFPADLLQVASFELRAFGGDRPGGESGRAVQGALKLANPDGKYDAAALLGWDRRALEIWRGTKARAFRDFNLVLRGQALRVGFDEQSLTIALRDRGEALDQPVNAALFGGSGGLDGHEGIAGLAKPWVAGRVGNWPLVEIDPVNLVFMASDGGIEAFDEVRDKGIVLTPTVDVADYTALLAEALDPGEYATCLALGILRLGAAPAGEITADLRGDNSGSGYVETTAEIARRVVTSRLGAGNLSGSEIDELAVTALASAQPAPVGYGAGVQQVSARKVLDDLLGAIGGWHTFTRDGRFTVARLDLTGTAAETLEVKDMAARQPPARVEVAPVWQVRVGWGRAWLVQTPDALAGEAENKSRYGEALRFAPAQDSTIRSRHRGARVMTIEAYFWEESDAQSEAARLLALYGPDRDIWSFGRLGGLRRRYVGDTVTLDLNRYGHPKTMQVIGLREDFASGEGSLTLWG